MCEVALVVVLYRPKDLNVFLQLALEMPTWLLVLVDNTPDVDLGARFVGIENIRYVGLGENLGVALAQNKGLAEAKSFGAKWILFFDQDSQISARLARDLVTAHIRLKERDPCAFILGPVLRDALMNGCLQRRFVNTHDEFVANDLIASSGSVFALVDAERVGPLDERLFIADVDYEWIWRANAMGMRSYQTSRIQMLHSIGEKSVYLFGRKLGISAPIRYYYQFRNWFMLRRRAYVPRAWCFHEMRNLVFAIGYVLVFGPQRMETLRLAAKGIADGVCSR